MSPKSKIKSELSKVKFFIGRNPEIDARNDWNRFIPKQYKSVLLLSADFELAWAWRYSKSVADPMKRAMQKAGLERENLPKLVRLCEQYNIPVTWATVGHLFLENCEKENGKLHPDVERLKPFENDYWKFNGEDWFEHDPGSSLEKDPEWYCPDLIQLIQNSEVDHEIACHTFSHIDCSDEICNPKVIDSELKKCKTIAEEWKIDLKSFVHPGHTIGNLETLAKNGFTNYRTNYRNVLGYPRKHECGMWEFEQTAEIAYRKEWSTKYHLYRYKKIVERAILSHTLCVLWFHPSLDPIMVKKVLPDFFQFLDLNRKDIWITTHSEYINWLQTSVNNE